MPREDYLVTIGLEVHCQLSTDSKMFCGCPVRFGEPPNTLTCPVCLGLPGALPVLNAGAIERTILTGLMLGCSTPPVVKWDRKNYFYPDMPKNYQTSQFDLPLCLGGGVPLYDTAYPRDWQKKIVRPGHVINLTRIHLEEDVGKSTHHGGGANGYTTLDFNRAGTPLMEIVSEPEIESAEEAVAYLNSLRQILIYGGVGDADMEKGQMRCDVNISLRPHGQQKLGTKIELKNLNSVSAIRRAIHHEIDRQAGDLDRGIPQIQSTLRWDDERGETALMRTKEDAHDYRYFPCPDLLPLHTSDLVATVRGRVPELPHEKRARFVRDSGLTEYDAGVLASEKTLADYFETAAAGAARPKAVANWIINDLLSALNAAGLGLDANPVSPAHLRELATLVEEGKINGAQAKEVFSEVFASGAAPADVVKSRGFEQVSDTGFLDDIITQVLAANADAVERIKAGNDKAINALKGQVMKLSQGKANPKVVGALLEARLKA
ncbi:MAG: Asp-tRNA(Asn)/Glu-tRNA(Gln) amidotransferase subunit GatB [Verrucomicrobiaceae bacterium]|nr:MAG: Asp-tRNA(Asn)/Glu-tRNA(Gln) amidotransferase subunit GatB [Verrucomicrobiaceae bacterium]